LAGLFVALFAGALTCLIVRPPTSGDRPDEQSTISQACLLHDICTITKRIGSLPCFWRKAGRLFSRW
jgi:hypothetical protein